MRILVLTPFYAPDLGPSAALYEMLSEELTTLGHEVSVISAVPHYPTGRVAEEFRGSWTRRERRNGVDVTRVWVPSVDRSRLWLRLMSFLCYQLLATAVGIGRKYDAVIASNPAFEVLLPLFLLAFFRRKPVIYSVHEVYPDVGVAAGIFRHRAVIQLVAWLERLSCKRAIYVRVLSEGYRRALEARGVPASKLAVIGDWMDTEFVRPFPRRNPFTSRWGLDGCFVVMYAGNLGPTQGLESVVEAARLLAADPLIRFVFVGDGSAKAHLERRAIALDLPNLVFVPFQPRELLPEVLSAADVSLVALKKGLGAGSVPSKLYAILASGRPVLAAVDPDSDTANLIREAQCGLTVTPEDPEALCHGVLELCDRTERRRRMGENGREYVARHRSKRLAGEKFHELLLSIYLSPRAPAEDKFQEGRAVPHG
jgi:putative colanic acid biosynthesis glycosyltransferase WcaI